MLLKKMFRDFLKNKGQFISIILLAFLGVFVYAGVSAMGYGLKASYTSYYDETNFSDYWIYGKDFSADDVEKLKQADSISDAQRRVTIDMDVNGSDSKTVKVNFLEENKINTPKIMDGADFDIDSNDGIWLDKRFAEKNDYNIGDKIKLRYNGVDTELDIKGLVYGSEYIYFVADDAIYPDFENLGYAFCSVNVLDKAGVSELVPFNQIVLKSDEDNKDEMEKVVSEKLDGGYAIIIDRKDFASHNMIEGEFDEAKSMSTIFPVVFALVALLTILITMKRLIKVQRTQIGTLKALGFSNKKILLHYVSYGFFTSLIGAVLGVVLGPVTLPSMFWPSYKMAYTLPEWKGEFQTSSLIIAVIFVVFCTGAVYLACHKILKESASQALRPEAPSKFKQYKFMNSNWWKKRSFYTQWNVRSFMRSKLKLLIGILGTAGCMGLLVSAFLCNDSFDYMKKWMYDDISKYDYQVFFDKAAGEDQKNSALVEIDGESMMTDSIVIRKDPSSDKKTSKITVVENGESDLYCLVDHKLDTVKLADSDFAISEQLAKVLGVEKGDTVQWHLYTDEVWVDSKITVLNRVPMGQGIWMTKEYLENAGVEYDYNIGMTNKDISSNSNDSITKVYNRDDILEAWDKGLTALNLMIYLLIIAAIVLAIVVLYNIGAFSFMESSKEFAQLRIIGFQNKDIKKILIVQNLWLSGVGIVIGIPLGYALLKAITSSVGEDYDFVLSISPIAVLISAAITAITGLVVTLMFSKKIKKMNFVEECKANE